MNLIQLVEKSIILGFSITSFGLANIIEITPNLPMLKDNNHISLNIGKRTQAKESKINSELIHMLYLDFGNSITSYNISFNSDKPGSRVDIEHINELDQKQHLFLQHIDNEYIAIFKNGTNLAITADYVGLDGAIKLAEFDKNNPKHLWKLIKNSEGNYRLHLKADTGLVMSAGIAYYGIMCLLLSTT
jgi:hypothetical protein